MDYIEENMGDALALDTQQDVLTYALSETLVSGHHLEFGVFAGGSIRYLANARRSVTFHGFDSFRGLPEPWSGVFNRGAFSQRGRPPRVPKNVLLHPGLFVDSLPHWCATHPGPAAFIHIDCDIYTSTTEVLAHVGDRLQPGTIVVFDEYFNYSNWKRHEYRAWQEFVAERGVGYEYLAYGRQQAVIRITRAESTLSSGQEARIPAP